MSALLLREIEYGKERKIKVYMDENENLRGIIGRNIAGLRTGAKVTQLELAEMLNYSDKAISKWERGESIPDLVVMKRLADIFGVSVDYFLKEKHDEGDYKREPVPATLRRNRTLVTLLAVSLVFLIATFLFVVINLAVPDGSFPTWLLYVYSVPVSFLLLLIFNSVWGKKKLNYPIISVFVWTLLASIYLSVLTLISLDIWLVFMLGIPAQIIIVLWSGLNVRKRPMPVVARTGEEKEETGK